jgi:hypothetical protein
MVEVLGVKNASKLIPMEEDMKPTDPVTENQNILKNKPVKAFIEQNHQAHIAVHMSAMKDPKIQQIIGMNPQMAQALQMAMLAHVNEHVGFEYRRQIEQAMNMQLPVVEEGEDPPVMDPMMAGQVAQLAAQASQMLLGQNQQQAAQQAAQQQAQDPLIQMQQQELQLKAKDVDIKERKLAADAAGKADQLDIEKERIASQERIAGMNVGAKVQKDKAELAAKQELEGTKLGVDIAKSKEQFHVQRQSQRNNQRKENK